MKSRELIQTKTVEFSTEDTYERGEPKATLLFYAALFLQTEDAVLIGLEFDRVAEDDTVVLFLTYEV